MKDKIFDNDFFHKLNNINIYLNKRLSQGYQGGRKSNGKGVSVEFSDFREYMPGDDFRRIDWNAYGRFNKFFIKIFMEEREGIFNFFIDKSKSMDFGEHNKSYMALRIVGTLSYIILNNLDKVQINTLDSGELTLLKTVSGKQAFQKLLIELSSIEFNGTTDLTSSILKRNIKIPGVSIIISDFFNQKSLNDLEQSIKYLAFKKQQILLIQILCKEERVPEQTGELTIIDSETGEKIKITVTPQILKNYENTLIKYTQELEQLALKYGAKIISVNSEDSIEKIILREFTKKQILY